MLKFRVGNGYDVHVLKEGLPLWICGVKIDSPFGCVAHSDGDFAIHALCDALLGCLALGDIGKFFPDNDMRWKDIDSKILLKEVTRKINDEGWQIENVDITIALQQPKLRPHIDTMREVLAGVMGIDKGCVSVKATTTEHLGFTGRGEGCQAWATALISSDIPAK